MSGQESYEATINVRHISTSLKARNGLSLDEAKRRATSNLRYITRSWAIWDGDVIGHSQGITMIAEDSVDRRAAREMTLWALEARAEKHRPTTGVRLADTLIISLPRDASPEHHREMVAGIVADLGGESDAWLIGAIHRDREGNPHLHLLAIDGLETEAQAKARRPDAKRVRRADALRLNQGGNRQSLRARIAAQINAVSEREGYRRAEIRSYEARGVARVPGHHYGPKMQAIVGKLTAWFASVPIMNDDPFTDLLREEPQQDEREASNDRMRQVIQERINEREKMTKPRERANIRY